MPEKPKNDRLDAVREAQTDGSNYDLVTEDIIAHLKKWQKLCSFRVLDADYNTIKIKFDTLPKDLDGFCRDACEFCPDLVADDEEIELPMFKRGLAKSKKLTLWWD
jgi:hypothetical protein